MMSKSRWIVLLTLVAVILAYWWLRPRPKSLPEAYVGERNAKVWSTTAQVRQTLAVLHYGDRVDVLARRGEWVHVRTTQGIEGWLDAGALMEPALWQRSTKLVEESRAMIVQARGRTKAPTNAHIDPGRNTPRLYQLSRDTPVEVLARAVAEWAPPAEGAAAKESGNAEQKPKREDWLLVRGRAASAPDLTGAGPADAIRENFPVVGWVLGRFLELDLPQAVSDYASSAALRVIAWFELNRVAGEGGSMPQYLVAGAKGAEGQACDFTMLRVYTWSASRKRYETAYVDGNLCGKLPIRVARTPAGDPEFRFAEAGPRGEERTYVMHQTVVRRMRAAERSGGRRR
jgi:hypothetical protein